MNKKIYIYKIIFITIFILIVFDIAGCIKNIELLVFYFFAIMFIIHGIYIVNFFPSFKKGFYMIFVFFKNIFNSCFAFFIKNKKSTIKNSIKKMPDVSLKMNKKNNLENNKKKTIKKTVNTDLKIKKKSSMKK